MVVSGTFGVLYDLVGASAEDMRLSPILKRFRTAPPLDFGRDICQTDDQADGVWRQLRVGVVQVLLKYSDGFSSYEDSLDPRLQHARRRSPPFRQGIKTKQFPLRLTKIEENTIHNQPDIIVEFYERQLGLSGESELADVAIPCYNDQLTNTLLRSAQVLRQNDVNALLRLENFQLAPGLFHLAMNFNWAINSTHIGTPTQLGSGSYIFHHVLKRSRLSNERPDYYTLQQALFETSDAIVLSGWTLQSRKCGFPTLAAFAASKPAPEELLRIADLVLETCVLPMEEPHTLKLSKGRKSRKEEDVSSTTKEELMPAPARGDASAPIASVKKRKKAAQQIKKEQSIEQIDERTPAELTAHIRAMSNPYSDIAHRNFRLFARDILLSKELVSATSAGDFGRIEDLLGVLAMIFRGAGSNKYCYENLHLIHNLKNVWTSKFAYVLLCLCFRELKLTEISDIMRDNIFVNMSGNAQRSMAVDLNIEHLIGCLKVRSTCRYSPAYSPDFFRRIFCSAKACTRAGNWPKQFPPSLTSSSK